MSDTCHVAGSLFTSPADSAGNPSPVVRPKPSVAIWAARPAFTELLRDLDGADVGGLGQDLRGRELLGGVALGVVEHPAVDGEGLGTVNTSSGEMIPSWSAAENVTSLKTDPGSYTWVSARFWGACTTVVTGGGSGGVVVVVVDAGVEPLRTDESRSLKKP